MCALDIVINYDLTHVLNLAQPGEAEGCGELPVFCWGHNDWNRGIDLYAIIITQK